MFESIILGTIQGIVEWLPVSSEGVIFLVKTNFFNNQAGFLETASYILFLHLGTFLAALIYFRKEVWSLLKSLLNYRKSEKTAKNILNFLIISTLFSGVFGLLLLKTLSNFEEKLLNASTYITLAIGVLLLITAYLQIKAKRGGERKGKDIKNSDSILLGFMQGLASLPGLSRSGLTVSTLLLRKFNEESALKLSFLMSLPIVLGGNIILNFNELAFSINSLVGVFFSFIFGLLTINILLKIAKKVNFGYFVLGFALLTILSVLI